jgi:hypothetical protein
MSISAAADIPVKAALRAVEISEEILSCGVKRSLIMLETAFMIQNMLIPEMTKRYGISILSDQYCLSLTVFFPSARVGRQFGGKWQLLLDA